MSPTRQTFRAHQRRVTSTAISLALAGAAIAVPVMAPNTPFMSLPSASAQAAATGPVNDSANGNLVLNQLYKGGTPPLEWPSAMGNSYGMTAIPAGVGTGKCGLQWVAQTNSMPVGTNNQSADVYRSQQVTPANTAGFFTNPTTLPQGVGIMRPAAAGETPTYPNGMVKVSATDAGSTTLALDCWTTTRNTTTINQFSRLRFATSQAIDNFRMVWRLDDNTTLLANPMSTGKGQGWWASGYTDAAPLTAWSQDPQYTNTSVVQGGTATVPVPTGTNGAALSPGTRFSVAGGMPPWATLNDDGSISLNPAVNTPVGDYPVSILVVLR